MELEVAIVLMLGVGFLAIVGYKAFKNYNTIESEKVKYDTKLQTTDLLYQQKISHLENSNKAYMYKIRKLRDTYDLDYDDVDYDEEEDEEFRLSELAKAIYPKLPDSLSKIIDKEEFQNAIIKTVNKKPDIITTFVDKWLNKTDAGSNSNSTPKLTETYL